MAVLTVQAQLTPDQILESIRAMETSELERLTDQVLDINAERRAPRLNGQESQLMECINRGHSPEFERRYAALLTKSKASSLSPNEQDEFCSMIDKVETLHVERLRAVSDLAVLRGMAFDDLMRQLGLLNDVA